MIEGLRWDGMEPQLGGIEAWAFVGPTQRRSPRCRSYELALEERGQFERTEKAGSRVACSLTC
jgi:hypothetical protein